MASYKQLAQQAEERLLAAGKEIAELTDRIQRLQDGIFEDINKAMPNEDAKAVLRTFGERAQNRDELILLIRALSNLPE